MSLFSRWFKKKPQGAGVELEEDFIFHADLSGMTDPRFSRKKRPDAQEMVPIGATVPKDLHTDMLEFMGANNLTMYDLVRMTNSIGYAVLKANPSLIWFFKQGRHGELPKNIFIRL